MNLDALPLEAIELPRVPGSGADGCKGGWCRVCWQPQFGLHMSLHPSMDSLVQQQAKAEGLLLVDMPMGLPYTERPFRACDQQARRLLPGRGATVFSPPCREALTAENYPRACAVNKHLLGRKISIQAYNIMPKILECDTLLRRHPGIHEWLLEAHPELAFAALAGTPLPSGKRTAQGQELRLSLLERVMPQTRDFVATSMRQHPRSRLALDDLLDATALAWAAALGLERLDRLPQGAEEYDQCGLPMRIMLPAPPDRTQSSRALANSASTA